MLVEELGVDCGESGRQALLEGRERWRRVETATVVRDAPARRSMFFATLATQ